jgi:hypothetical protein
LTYPLRLQINRLPELGVLFGGDGVSAMSHIPVQVFVVRYDPLQRELGKDAPARGFA